MKAPLSWLKEYVEIPVSPEVLEEKLFSCGLEVEETIYVGKNIDKIVFCKVLEIKQHENADKLSVCQVDAGKYGVLQIVTNAKNIAVNDIVPVAVDGATLNNGDRIFKGKLRGVESFGMFCSGEELGITDEFYDGASTHGVLVFKEDYPLGEEVKKVLGIEDVIFDINVTANRPDCQSIVGIAREIAAVLGTKFTMPATDFKVNESLKTEDKLTVKNEAVDLCPRYIGWYVDDIKIEKSPKWITKKLASVGIRSINNIVDITNFVLTELGQPMHAFDYDKIGDKTIIIRRANDGEKVVTLDRKEFVLDSKNLVICDKTSPVALAGIMGGLDSEITDNTKAIVFESAKFKRDNIRKTSRKLGQRSDSSSRYEKGVDAYTTGVAIKRALNLIDTLNAGVIAKSGYDLPKQGFTPTKVTTTFEKINGVLGIEVPKEKVVSILESLDFKVEVDKNNLTCTVPMYREDVESYQDIAEEVIREYGYGHIVPTLLKNAAITAGGLTDAQRDVENLKEFFVYNGFNEIITYSFVSEKEFDTFSLSKDKIVKIINPLGEDLGVMRTSLIPSMVSTIARNLNRKNLSARLFEFASIYEENGEEIPKQNKKLCFGVYGEGENFFKIKGVLSSLFSVFCYKKEISYERSKKPFYHPTLSADISIDGNLLGSFGALHPEIAEKYDIDTRIFVGEFDYETLKNAFNKNVKYETISKFPSIERDLAVTVNKAVLWGDIYKAVKESGGKYLNGIKLFDIYEGDQIEAGKKSVAFNLTFVSNEKTLPSEDVDKFVADILSSLKEKTGAELR